MLVRNLFLAVCFILVSCGSPEQRTIDYVDPFIGTGGHGHTFPGATLPHGLVQLSPDTRLLGWDACGGYHYDDNTVLGFSHTHISGTGIGDYGDILFLPFTGQLPNKVVKNGENHVLRYGSSFSHDNEKASPGYYKVKLEDYEVTAELTATPRTGLHRYTFQEADQSGVMIDLTTSIHGRTCLNAQLEVVSDTEIRGMKHIEGWAPDRQVHFYAQFSKPFTAILEVDGEEKPGLVKTESTDLRAFLDFGSTSSGEVLIAKVGISFVDGQGARQNLEVEVPGWDFDSVRETAESIWEEELSRIEVVSKDETAKSIFYTGLYHTMIAPSVASDVDGRYRRIDQKISQSDDYTNYTIFSLWDTFRSLHPLYTIISPDRNEAMIRSLLKKYDEGGMLPMWELASNYTGTMIGYHAVSVIVDAYMKGYRDFDLEKAYEACKRSSIYDTTDISAVLYPYLVEEEPHPIDITNELMPIGKQYKNTTGYIPSDRDNMSVAKGLEYAYNDWLIAEFARELGEDEDYSRYAELGMNYKHYFDASTGFMRGKLEDGSWVTPFDPSASNHFKTDYCEGNAWQWTWFAPHDIGGLVELMGGKDKFITKLDSLFFVSSEIIGEQASPDITGMIGQYAHGNEPSHQTVHIYNFIGQPWKTQELVDRIVRTLYLAEPDGVSGNEDCGQMSAWYVLNSMGFFPYCPGIPEYSIGRPLFDETRIKLRNGNVFIVRAPGNSEENKYVQSARLNGELLDTPFFTHEALEKGGVLELQMGAEPNTTWRSSRF